MGRAGGMEERIIPAAGVAFDGVPMRGVQPEIWRNLPLAYSLPASVAKASRLIASFRPDVVFGTGGYVVAAVGAAARLRRRPLFLQVPDAVPGRAIRWLAPGARTVFTAYEETARRLPRARCELTGTPVRDAVLEAMARRRARLSAGPGGGAGTAASAPGGEVPRTLLVFGGSQGAHRLNVAVEESVKALMELPGLRLVHVCGAPDHDALRRFRGALPAETQARYDLFDYNPQLAGLMAGADLVLARAGGSSIAELTALGLPMILVPYPFAGAHQARNAEPVARAGAAVLVPDAELSGVRLAQEVRRVWDGDRLAEMASRSAALGRPDAARAIARRLLEAA